MIFKMGLNSFLCFPVHVINLLIGFTDIHMQCKMNFPLVCELHEWENTRKSLLITILKIIPLISNRINITYQRIFKNPIQS